MSFKFDITLSEQDFYDYNIFMVIRSYYGKKSLFRLRIIMAALILAVILIFLVGGGFSADAWIGSIPYILLLLLFQLGLAPFMRLGLRIHIKGLKKSGKLPFSPVATMEFYDDHFNEITPDHKTEHSYSAIERISILEGKWIYLHINNAMAYIIPGKSFASDEEYQEFTAFIGTKTAFVDQYK